VADDAWQPFAKLIAKGDAAGVVALLEPLDETARKRFSTQAKRAAKEVGWGRSGRHDAAHAAQFGTGGPAASVRQWWFLSGDDAGPLRERLVRSRPRAWRQEWAERVCSQVGDAGTWGQWELVHGMVQDGAIDRPESQGYVVGAVASLPDWSWPRSAAARPLADILRGEPAWLQRDLWELFAIEETGLTSADVERLTAWARSLAGAG